MIDRLILDSKTDTTLACQTSVLTAAAATDGGGIHACIEGNILGLELLTALPPYTLWAFALRLRADCSRQEIRRGAAEFAARPEDILALAAPLYEIEMPVHCFPIYWQGQHERLHALSDLREPVPRSVFSRPDLPCPRLLGHHVGRVRVAQLPAGPRDGTAPRRFPPESRHGASEVLRHQSTAATLLHIADSVRLTSFASSMTAATARRRPGAAATPGERLAGTGPPLPPRGGQRSVSALEEQRELAAYLSIQLTCSAPAPRGPTPALGTSRGTSSSPTCQPGVGPWPIIPRVSGPGWTRGRASGPWVQYPPRSSLRCGKGRS